VIILLYRKGLSADILGEAPALGCGISFSHSAR